MDEKSIAQIKKYVKGKKFLIVDNSSVGKASIKKMLTQTAVSKTNILSANNFEDAKEIVKNQKPEWIFCNYMIGGESYEELLSLHLKMRPERITSGFILLSENNSLEISVHVAQSQVDKLVLIPFTVVSLQQEFLKVMLPKANPTPYQVHVELGKQYFYTDPDKALSYFNKAKRLEKGPTAACYYEGMLYLKEKSLEKARSCFEEGLKYQPLHYQCLSELFQIMVKLDEKHKAYKLARCLIDHYPVNPELLPTLTWLSVACAEYDDIFEYHSAFKQVVNPDKDMKNYIAASMAIYGKKVIKDKFKEEKETSSELYSKALEVIERASEICDGKPLIYASLVEALKEAQEIELLDRVLSKALAQFPESREIRILEVLVGNLQATAAEGLKLVQDSIQKGLKSPELYEVLIKRAIEMNLAKQKVEEHYEKACRDFPDKRNSFEELISEI